MDYKKVLELCGAEVLYMQKFGSWQGDWWAKVKYNNKIGWINEPFGSCSSCDIIQSILSNYYHDHDNNYDFSIYSYDLKEDCEICQEAKSKFISLGQGYLEEMMSQEEAELKAEECLDWDYEAREMLFQIKMNHIVEEK